MKRFLALMLFICSALILSSTFASATDGTIDPNDTGDHFAKFYDVPGETALEINFGKFTTQSAKNIHITSAGFRGFAWGELTGWIVTNCLDTTSGCSSTNGNFKIAVASDGTLSGYAWGENTGWINFGPFSNSSTPQVQIGPTGIFKGTTGDAGYAWSQNFGWILFDCTQSGACVTTDYIPTGSGTSPQCSDSVDNDGDGLTDYPSDPGCTDANDDNEANTTSGGGGGGGNSTYVCSDGVDNDADGYIDYPSDPGCLSATDTDETNTITQCSDHIDNDGDGIVDYPNDPGCVNFLDNNELDTVFVPSYICSDGVDNDKDGKTDYPSDPGCVSSHDMSEVDVVIPPPPVYICSDGIDNDGDGKTDYPSDPGCATSQDANEFNDIVIPPITYICSDSVDNDGDGKTDYPSDPGCSNQFDQSEIDSPLTDTTDEPPNDPGNPILSIKDIFPGLIDLIDERGRKIGIVVAVTGLGTTFLIGVLRVLLNSPGFFSNFFAYIERTWSTLLSFLGFRRYSKWGVVFDAQTKQAIDPAYVRLIDEAGKEVATAITDINGHYGFLAEPGTYTMTAQKTHYMFPSQVLSGKDHDEIYSDLYFGEKIIVAKKDEVIVKNIPMDATGFDWNEFAKRDKKILNFFIRHEVFFTRLINVLFYFGFLTTIIIFILTPILYNAVILGLYIIFEMINRSTLLKPRASSVLRNGKPYPFVLVEIYNATLNQKISRKITSAYGRFFALVPKGEYYLKILEKSSTEDDSYIPVYTSDVFNAKEGYIHRTIII